MKFSRWIYLATGLGLLACEKPYQNLRQDNLNQDWKFRQEGAESWREAEVPGVIHTDLLNHGFIPHPWIGTNEDSVQWVEHEVWVYECEFDAQQAKSRDHAELIFKGLDTYAEVALNDSLILKADNMFREWRVPVKDLLKKRQNKLTIRFLSPVEVNLPKLKSLGYELPASSETVEYKVSPFTRKAPYHFGWDWGPRLVTSGIWRPVILQSWDRARIADVQVLQKKLTDSVALMEALITISSGQNRKAKIKAYGVSVERMLDPGQNKIVIPFSIDQPKRWWPNGWGEPHLYRIPVSLKMNGFLLDSTSTKVGLRMVELVQEKDSIGESFYFKVNGKPLFARGANYIPQSHFLPSVSPDDYTRLISDVKNANMNMLRVWGGGIYENDIFYDLCDQNGILVWQDFMFANTMYPGDSDFLKNVEEEVIYNVKRLRNHPSIIHWNGNNEIEVAWKNWGWQSQYGYSPQDSIQLWDDYLELFHQRIPKLLDEMDDRSYTSTSPLSNWGTPGNFNYGSMHYWGVWHGGDEFEDYRKNVGRFMSEYGFQSFPPMETVSFFSDSSEWHLDLEVMKHHQKSYVGNGIITRQIEKYFERPSGFPDFVIKSQKAQAKAMQIAIDAHRLSKGHCWGSLFWQLNDCWPGPSWSSMDVFGRKKVLYDDLKVLFAPIALIPERIGDQLRVTLVNDRIEDFDGIVRITFYKQEVVVSVNEEPVICKVDDLAIVYQQKMNLPKDCMLKLELFEGSEIISSREVH